MNALIYLMSDTLGIDLHEVGEGKVRGSKFVNFKMRNWSLQSDCVTCSDVLEENRVSFFTRIKGDVWVYFVLDKSGDTMAYVFDGGAWKLKSKDVSIIGTGSVLKTLTKFKALIKTVFKYSEVEKEWGELNVSAVDEAIEGEGLHRLVTSVERPAVTG